jgi:hypothetical protein
MSNKQEIYISIDIEADGKIPGDSSMLSLGAAAFYPDGEMVSTFSINLETLPNAIPDKDTMAWWAQNDEAYQKSRKNVQDPKAGMTRFVQWVEALDGNPVALAYPAGYDWSWIYWYMIHFVGRSPFSFSCLDIKSYAMSMLKSPFRKTTKKNMPKRWFSKEKHTHVAVQDAIEQGELFINMLKENLKK